jgi:hypothetical protein
MKQRLGALLCLALGAVLITTGLTAGGNAAVGGQAPNCGTDVIGVAIPCPTGTISITKTTIIPEGATVTPPPGGWKVDITSTCQDPLTNDPVAQTVTVPDNDTATSTQLFVYMSTDHATKCSYALAEQPVAGFTGVFDPVSPVELPFDNEQTGNNVEVDLTNTAEVPSSTPPSSDVPSSSAPSPTEIIITDSGLAPTASPIANTGPREQVRTSVYIGVALCLLGLVLLFAGSWSRRRGQHTG